MLYKDYKPGVHKLLRHLDHLDNIIKAIPVAPIHVSVWPTNQCQLNCSYCCCRKMNNINVAELDIDLYKDALLILRKYGTKAIEMSLRGDEIIYIEHEGEFKVLTIKDFVSNYKKYKNSYSWSLKDTKIKGKITNVYEHNLKEDLIKITLKTGKTITTTKNHSIFFFNNNKIIKKRMDEAKINDLVVLSKSNLEIKTKCNYNINLSLFDDRFKNRPKNLDINKDVARLLGYFNAEGTYTYCRGIVHGISLCFDCYKNESKYIDDVIDISRTYFDCEPSVYKYTNKTKVVINRKWVGELFQSLDCGQLSRGMRVPNIIFNLDNSCKMEYLKGLFAGDGNFRDTIQTRNDIVYNRNSLHLKTSSIFLVRTLSLLLDILNIENTITSGKNKERFIEGRKLGVSSYYGVNIYGYNNLKKIEPVITHLGKSLTYKKSIFSTATKGKSHTLKIKINDDAFALPIKSIETISISNEKVYDIEVKNTNRFESSFRILCHNSGGGEPLLWSNFEKGVNFAHTIGFKQSLITNGLALKDVSIETLSKFSWIRISVQSVAHAEKINYKNIPVKKSISYIMANDEPLLTLDELYKFCVEQNLVTRVAVQRPCSLSRELDVRNKVNEIGAPFFFSEKKTGQSKGCYMAWIRAAIDWRGNFLPCPSIQLNTENEGFIPDKFILCHIKDLEKWIIENPPRDLGYKCTFCNCGKEENDIVHELLEDVEDADFV